MIQIRRNVFETNSSSTHSVSIISTVEDEVKEYLGMAPYEYSSNQYREGFYNQMVEEFGEKAVEEEIHKYIQTPHKRQEILDSIKNYTSVSAHNSMGCSEDWYSVFYAMKQVFTEEQLEAMNNRELNLLVRLGDAIAEGLY